MISKRLVAKSGKKRLLEAVANVNPTLVPIGESPMAQHQTNTCRSDGMADVADLKSAGLWS